MRPPSRRAGQRRPRAAAFLGRAAELDDLERKLLDGAALLTITGPAGVGKTALARRLEERLRARPELGSTAIWFADVAEARDAEAVAGAVARTIGTPVPATRDRAALPDLVARALGGHGSAILFLDDFEHVVPMATPLVEAWLASCPDLQIVLTSRRRLRIPDEQVFELGPLSLPVAGEPQGGEAVALWIERVRALRPDYVLTEAEAPSVARLVRELDGLPLAIELAAARSSVLGPREIVERLPQVVLEGPSADAPGTSLHRALESSYEALGEPHRARFAQCSVFLGGFAIDAAEAVLEPCAETSVLATIEALRERSLLRTRGGAPGELRSTLYQSVRAFAATKLASDPRQALRARHAAFYAGWIEALEVDALARSRLLLERDNLEAVMARAQERADPTEEELTSGLRVLSALATMGRLDLPLDVALDRFDSSLAAPRAAALPGRLRGKAVVARARLLLRAGRLDASKAAAEEALELARAHGSPTVEALATEIVARIAALARRIPEGRALGEKALALANRSDDPLAIALVTRSLAATMRLEGRPEQARSLLEALLAANRRNRDAEQEAWTLGHLGLTLLEMGDLEGAREYAARAAAACSALEDHEGLWNALMASGGAAISAASAEGAERAFDEAYALARRMGDARMAAFSAAYGAISKVERGATAPGMTALGEAIAELRHAGRNAYAATFAGIGGAYEANAGRLDAARSLFASASELSDAERGSSLGRAVDLLQACLELAEARAAGEERPEVALRARERLARVRARDPATDGERLAPLVSRSLEVRLAARLVDRALGDAPGPATPAELRAPGPELTVEPEGKWFAWRGGERIACGRRPVIRRMLKALVEARLAQPGRPVPADLLLAAGWPDEKILPDAAKNRLRVAVCRLRDLGLRDALVVAEGGYLLDPAKPVELARESG